VWLFPYVAILPQTLQVLLQYVSEQLGHASIKILIDTYGHPRQGTSLALADRLDSTGATALRYATSTPLETSRTEEYAVISTG